MCPQGEPHLSLVSLEGSPRSAGELTQAPFKFPLVPWVPECEILYVPFKSGVCFPQPYWSPESKPHWLKPNVLRAHSPSAGPSGWHPKQVWTLYLLGRTSAIVIILSSVSRLPADVGLDYTMTPPLLPISLCLLYIFSCRRSSLLIFRLFSLTVAL